MAVKIVIPREGQSMETALIVEWCVKVGDVIEFGDVICEVESEKAAFPIESPVAGTVLDIFFEEGEDAPVLETIAVIGKPGEQYDHLKPGAGGKEPEPEAPAPAQTAEPSHEAVTIEKTAKVSKGKKMSPKARKLAKEAKSGETLKGMRKIISDNLLASMQSSAQFTLHSSADATELLSKYRILKDESGKARKITLNDLLLYSVVETLKKYPGMNAHFDNISYKPSKDINLGFAVDVAEGLRVPVIRKTQEMDLETLSGETAVLIEKCRAGSVRPDELEGGTFTVSNLGAMGVEKFTPILNYPEVGILGIGGITPKAVRRNEQIEYVDSIEFSLTLNHQVVDGAKGARFLQDLAETIANMDFVS